MKTTTNNSVNPLNTFLAQKAERKAQQQIDAVESAQAGFLQIIATPALAAVGYGSLLVPHPLTIGLGLFSYGFSAIAALGGISQLTQSIIQTAKNISTDVASFDGYELEDTTAAQLWQDLSTADFELREQFLKSIKGKKEMKALFEMSKDNPDVDVIDLFSDKSEILEASGRNSLAIGHQFKKHFFVKSIENEAGSNEQVFGWNTSAATPLVGPGFFSVNEDDSSFVYTGDELYESLGNEAPEEAPCGIDVNEKGLSALAFNIFDEIRWVSPDVCIGHVHKAKNGKSRDIYFTLNFKR